MEDLQAYAYVPGYFADILDVIGAGDWLIHNFHATSRAEVFDPGNYLYNTTIENGSYTACMDLNVFQFIVNASRKSSPNDLYRKAIAYLTFFQIANIEVDPTLAVYEKANHQPTRAVEAVCDLHLFNTTNSLPNSDLAKYALGYSSRLNVVETVGRDPTVESELTRYRRLTEWPSLYVIVLAIVSIEFDHSIPRSEKIAAFIDWSFRKFRHSLPGFVFALSVLGVKRLGRAMKYKPSDPALSRRSALSNMTWDLYYMKHYFQRWTERSDGQEAMFLTSDRAFGQLLSLAIDVQKAGALIPLESCLIGSDRRHLEYVLSPSSYPGDRVFGTSTWSAAYRDRLIASLEVSLELTDSPA